MFTKTRYILPVVCACTVTLITPAIASAGEVYHREINQENRIFDGVQDNQINPLQFRNLENHELSVNAQRTEDLKNDGGSLTPQNRQQLNNRLNNLSQAIHLDTAPPAAEVRQRETNQENRILAGVQAGQLNPGQFRRLENRELSVNTQRAEDLQNNEGSLASQDAQQLNDRLNNISHSIYQDRH
jgi:hypothetical protein